MRKNWGGSLERESQYLCGSSCSTCRVNDCEGLLLLFGCEKQKAFVEFDGLFFSFSSVSFSLKSEDYF